MDKITLLNCKALEYSARFLAAFHRGDYAKAQKLALTELVIYRLQARAAHMEAVSKHEEIRALNRLMAKAREDCVTLALAELRVRKLREERDAAEKELASIGGQMHDLLQLWQICGASFEDLCNVCNRDPEQVRKELGPKELDARPDASFSKLAMVFNLDYKVNRDTGWLEDSVDAPLTHALKAHLLDLMLHTEAGRKASHEAMEAIFPEIMENAMTVVTDADGVRHLLDKDGNEISTMEE